MLCAHSVDRSTPRPHRWWSTPRRSGSTTSSSSGDEMTAPFLGDGTTRGAFEAEVAERNVSAARLACILVAVLMPAGVALDWLTHPEVVGEFLILRLGCSAISLLLLFLTYAGWARAHAFLVGAAPAFVCAAILEVMVERLEGHASPYYAGLNLCILGMGLVFTWRGRETMIICGMIVGLWLVPSLLTHRPVSIGPFFNNLYFLSLTSVIAVWSNARRYSLAHRQYDAQGKLTRMTGELGAALDRLKELDRVKNEFFANISHELRTPLTLILAPVDELIGSAENPQNRGRLEVVRRNAERLLRLIDDLLDLARLEVGGLRLNVGVVDLHALTEQVVEAFRPAAEVKSVGLTLSGEGPAAPVFGDPHRLEMVITNLIGNALKFTPAGGAIRVRVERHGEGVGLVVEDTGPGIAVEELPRIFERFYQVEGSARRRHGGAGIGLALAKELIDLHGGRITVESELGKGTAFRLWLPPGRAHFRPEAVERRQAATDRHEGRRAGDRAIFDAGPSPTVSRPEIQLFDELRDNAGGGHRPRIVVAEDQEELCAFIRQILERSFDVVTAADGLAALEAVRRERPDLVLSDVMMPGMTGTELCRTIKEDPSLRAIPVILLTARVGSDAALEGYVHGADDYVTKPFHTRVLVARVQAQLRLRALGLQVVAQSRMAAIGTLAAGVAHEVRNPVNAIVNAADVLLREPSEGMTRKLLLVIADAGWRIDAITSALDEQVRPAEAGQVAPCDVRAGIDATLRLLEYRTGDVAVQRSYETERRVLAPAGELNQVFLNLLDNALRAAAKRIEIRVTEAEGKVVVRIADDGSGVSPEVAPRIFDPFFTTRQPGEGTGLGLYLSRRMVVQYGGDLRLDRIGAGGAEFAVELPAEV
ncbi:MAG: response regulator [Myxococcales bacterium]|nr:response regulator [Myxococcales bacterium]